MKQTSSRRPRQPGRRFSLALLGALAALIAAPFATPLSAAEFPAVLTSDLNGRKVALPSDLPADPTLVLVAFKREQQADLDVWIEELALNEPGARAWIELPVIRDYGSIFRNFVDNGMRSGIVTEEARSRVFTLYGDPDAFREALDLPTDEEVYILAVDRAGAVVARADGGYTVEKARSMIDAAFGAVAR